MTSLGSDHTDARHQCLGKQPLFGSQGDHDAPIQAGAPRPAPLLPWVLTAPSSSPPSPSPGLLLGGCGDDSRSSSAKPAKQR